MRILLMFLFLALTLQGFSQDFILKRRLADRYSEQFDYPKAIPLYEQLQKSHPDDESLYQKLALLYDHVNDSRNAERCYAWLAGRSKAASSDIYNYARTLCRNGKYAAAETVFLRYRDAEPNDPRGGLFAESCHNIQAFFRDSASFVVTKAPFSNQADDFSPSFYGKSIVFVSDRHRPSPIRSTYNWTQSAFLDLFRFNPESGEVNPFAQELNSGYHEGPVTFNKAQDSIIFTRSSMAGNQLVNSREGITRLWLYQGTWNAGLKKWDHIKPLNLANSEYSIQHPALSPDGSMLYFASDMPGGSGGFDLYCSSRMSQHGAMEQWGAPVNLGPGINSPGNELFPFVDKDGGLWYASDGIPGLGGLDIFYAARTALGFSPVLNPGYPLNTRFDDFGFITQGAGEDGWFSSDRNNVGGHDDIYSVRRQFPGLMVKVVDASTRKEIKNVTVRVHQQGMEPTDMMPDDSRPVRLVLNPYRSCSLTCSKPGYVVATASVGPGQRLPGDTLVVSMKSELPAIRAEVKLKPAADGTILPVRTISLTDKVSGSVQELFSDSNGRFLAGLLPGKDYLVRAVMLSPGIYRAEPVEFSTRGISRDSILQVSVPVLWAGEVIRLENIFYDLNKYDIRTDAARGLERVVRLMKEYPGMKIELGSHTDSRGTHASNMVLSEKRARSAMDYLLKAGIDKKRVTSRGYGDTKLINRCKTGVSCSEAEHQENRRTELKILKWE